MAENFGVHHLYFVSGIEIILSYMFTLPPATLSLLTLALLVSHSVPYLRDPVLVNQGFPLPGR